MLPVVGGCCESCRECSLRISSPNLFELLREKTVLLPGYFEKLDKFSLVCLASLRIESGVAFFLK